MLQKLFEAPFFKEWKQLYRGELSLQKVFWKYGVLCTTLLVFAATLGDLLFRGLSFILVFVLAVYLLFITNQLHKRISNWVLEVPLLIVGPVFSGLLILGLLAAPCVVVERVHITAHKRMNTAISRELMAMLSGAFSFTQGKKHLVIDTIGVKDLLDEMNYVTITKEKQIDSVAGEQSFSCANAQFTCLQLHNGSVLAFENQETFGGKQSNRAIKVLLDLDGSYSGKTTSPDDFNGNIKAVALYLYADGFIASDATLRPNTQSNLHHYNANVNKTPLWLRDETKDALPAQK